MVCIPVDLFRYGGFARGVALARVVDLRGHGTCKGDLFPMTVPCRIDEATHVKYIAVAIDPQVAHMS